MNTVELAILAQVKKVLETHPGGVEFFDKLDGEIVGNASLEIIQALFEKIPPKHFIVLSGGFGKKIASQIDNGELPRYPYVLFKGGIRSGGNVEMIKSYSMPGWSKKTNGEWEGIFLDDSIYGGATYYMIQTWMDNWPDGKLTKCAVIYDGCPRKKSYVASLFRYYDHFDATPNHKFD